MARWSAGGELPATVAALPQAPSTGNPVPLQRLVAGQGTGGAPPSRAASTPHEIVFPPRDGLGAGPVPGRAPAMPASAATPVQRSAPGAGPALPGFAAAPASSAERPPPMTLHHAAGPTVTYASPGSAAPAPILQRIVADPASSTAAPVVQASGPAGGSTLPGITATPVVQRVDGAAPPAGDASGGHTDTELDELARAIFGRIRGHLRSEVIHEREAKGLSFDAF
ncbi:MAG TPA: hypothetical protein VES19_08060 [Candidatus Limnocylindrales bacterium]|nr:hypothetical protein [Candidatus Limnocylindrales bacterium]